MDIQTFSDNYDNFSAIRKAEYLSRVITEIVHKDDGLGRNVIDNLLIDLQDLEADDYFGTEGYRD